MQLPVQPRCLRKCPASLPAEVSHALVKLQCRGSPGRGALLTSFPVLFPQVRHRWCELVIKHKYTKAYNQVERFLQEDQVSVIFQEVETGHHYQSQVSISLSGKQISERVSKPLKG